MLSLFFISSFMKIYFNEENNGGMKMENFVGIKELSDVSIRLNAPLEIGNKKYDINETILSFKTAEIAQINEVKDNTWARGGYHNRALVNWEIDREMRFAISHGVLSPTSWAILSNSALKEPVWKSIQYGEEVHAIEEGEYCYADLKHLPNATNELLGMQPNPDNEPLPMGRRPELMLKPLPPSKTKWIFVYDLETGERVREFEIYRNRLYFKKRLRKVYVDYTFTFNEKIREIEVGNRLLNGFLKLDGKMSVKDEKTGSVTTAILEMPKIKINSSLSILLGKNYDNSTVSDFFFTGYPVGAKEDERLAYITFLNMDITGDYI